MNTDEQKYLQSILDKFNANHDDPALKEYERSILTKIAEIQKLISDTSLEIEKTREEIKNLQDKEANFIQQLIRLQGHNQGLVDSILLIR